jgi:protein required for attachment to host cells
MLEILGKGIKKSFKKRVDDEIASQLCGHDTSKIQSIIGMSH